MCIIKTQIHRIFEHQDIICNFLLPGLYETFENVILQVNTIFNIYQFNDFAISVPVHTKYNLHNSLQVNRL